MKIELRWCNKCERMTLQVKEKTFGHSGLACCGTPSLGSVVYWYCDICGSKWVKQKTNDENVDISKNSMYFFQGKSILK